MKRVLVGVFYGLLASVVIVVIFLLIFPQTIPVVALKTKFPESKYPILYEIPKERVLQPNSFVTTQVFKEMGISLALPWTEIPKRTEKGNIVALVFTESRGIIFDGVLEKSINEAVYLKSTNEFEKQKIKDFYSDVEGYEGYKNLLYTSPAQLNVFTPRKEVLSKVVLAGFKVILVEGAPKPIFEFENSTIKGFHFGNSNAVGVHFFDNSGKAHVVVLRGVTEEELDFILNSIKVS